MLKIAITGGAGSGKSTVARMFRELGAEVLDADAVARDVVAVGAPAWEELRRVYGAEYFREDGTLDRQKVAARVFAHPEERSRLNAIIHPRLAAELRRRLSCLADQGAPLVLVEVPLLFEAGLENAYDRTIVVYADESEQVQRLGARDARSDAEIAGILAAQWPLQEKLARADFVVDNRGPLESTREQVIKIWEKLPKISLTARPKKG
jgi:dephospho-CoA kinase